MLVLYKVMHLTFLSSLYHVVVMDELVLHRSEEDVLTQEKLLKIEVSSDWPATIQPDTLLTLLSQSMQTSPLCADSLDKVTSHSYGLPWLLRLSQLANSDYVSAGMIAYFYLHVALQRTYDMVC